MSPRLSLDCLTLTDTAPAEMIRAAGAAGFDLVSLWFNEQAIYPGALVTAENLGECEAAMADTGVRLYTLEAFELTSTAAIRDLRPAFDRGARLGGKVALCYHHGAVDGGEATGLLAEFADVAAEFGLGTCIEPIAMGGTATLAQAAALIRASGCDARILFDTWHLMRTGGGLAELAALDPALLGYVQINDGLLTNPPEDAMAEVMGERHYPGSGEFPLAELLRITPRDIPWGIETPSINRVAAGRGAADQGREAMACMQGLLAQLS
jgi:sugar phosphate isomerase/epimerase